MATAYEHYQNFLAHHYSWLYGDFNSKVNQSLDIFKNQNLYPKQSKLAVDLGAGSGFQSIALARLGFSVTAIDFSKALLEELKSTSDGLSITLIQDDILNLGKHIPNNIELFVCMGDTLTHLNSYDEVESLLLQISQQLISGGNLVLSFRDLCQELQDLDRFIPVRSDSDKIFTCFLESDHNHIKVHDLLYVKENHQWTLYKSFYRKLRIPWDWIGEALKDLNFSLEYNVKENGLITMVARRK